jgi:hypothetical protein
MIGKADEEAKARLTVPILGTASSGRDKRAPMGECGM